ncbi:type II TA system antitoxin MqsA family protein [Achromobacter xylosoxidans]
MTQPHCPLCGEGLLTSHVEKNTLNEGSLTFTADLHYSICSVCEGEVVLPEQLVANKKSAVAAKGKVLGMPTPAQLKAWRAKHGLSQEAAGLLTGVGKVAFSKYENLALAPSAPTARLLHVLMTNALAVHQLAHEWNVRISDLPPTRTPWVESIANLVYDATELLSRKPNSGYINVAFEPTQRAGAKVNQYFKQASYYDSIPAL